MRAIVNSTYPGHTVRYHGMECGICRRVRLLDSVWATPTPTVFWDANASRSSTRWTAPDPANPNYLALKLFTNYDGAHHGFATTSISDTNDGESESVQQLCGSEFRRHSNDRAGAEQRSAKYGERALRLQRIHAQQRCELYAGFHSADDDFAFILDGVVVDSNVRAVHSDIAGHHRNHSERPRILVGSQS